MEGIQIVNDGGQEVPIEIIGVIKDVNQHGEVQATFEEHDAEVEIRQGTTVVNVDLQRFEFTTEGSPQYISFDRYVSHYKPFEFYHH